MMNPSKPIRYPYQGLILIEIAIGLAFTGFMLMGLTYLFTTGMEASLHSNLYTQAVYLAEEKIEETTIFPYSLLTSRPSEHVTINNQTFIWNRTLQPVENLDSFYQIRVQVEWEEKDGNHQLHLISRSSIKP